MTIINFRSVALGLAAACTLSSAALAAPVRYSLDSSSSKVGFETMFGADAITGTMPVTRADLTIDFERLTASKVAVALDVTNAEASFPFAAQAMKGPKVLDAGTYPLITFVSTAVRPKDASKAQIDGDITIRGVTRPITFEANIWRQQGSESGDLSNLTIRLTGAINRSDFGAVGWSDMVADKVSLDILARISKD
ncbi:YceI family protein [Tabrizicola sp. J26]|uniref:YceI family protein n=1 Tax=Alitabrizicola rongguiensis TaxID=2909234 RepID=UPI001F400510|nr:YceI family protein [Tabrizicola rongguiensis]MCF1708846.1 YceI family protein [Tabrizicola rongguiensis]